MKDFIIYKYELNNKVVYIGKTSHLKDRIRQHTKEIAFYGLTQIYYDYCKSEEELDNTENYLIDILRPILNKCKGQYNKDKIKNNYNWKPIEFEISYNKPLVEISNLSLNNYSFEIYPSNKFSFWKYENKELELAIYNSKDGEKEFYLVSKVREMMDNYDDIIKNFYIKLHNLKIT